RRIRQAIGYAIGRDKIIQNLFYGAAVPATGLLPPYHWAYERDVMKISHDAERAKRILEAAGYRDPDGDGPQRRFWLTLKISMNEFRRVLASVMQSDLESVGIGVKVRSCEWSTFFSDINRGNFQLCMLMWVGENDPDLYREIFSSNGARNRGKYRDPQIDEWVEKARVAVTEEEQKYYYSMVQKKVAEDCPYISLWYESNMALMRKELGGLRLTPDVSTRVLKDVYWN
ncbi:MAG TPA: ABC transporter substrate-binding protein, partial [Acidobacteriota bacterium]|nr:ABC transporter substrate-binding protein [Acidobacteriota bacterium]